MNVMSDDDRRQAEVSRKATEWMRDYTRACIAGDLYRHGLADIPAGQRRWIEVAVRLGYTGQHGHIAAQLAASRAELASLAPRHTWNLPPGPWRERAREWNRELVAAAEAGVPVQARPELPGCIGFAVPGIPGR
jgi:hypothetical protein